GARLSSAVARPADVLGLALFAALGCGLSALLEVLHRSRSRAEAFARETAAGRERLRVTLASIGDAVIATDADGRVTFLNAVAERLTGWGQAEAVGRPLGEVFQIVNEETRAPAASPV